jgi:hypothetical protein
MQAHLTLFLSYNFSLGCTSMKSRGLSVQGAVHILIQQLVEMLFEFGCDKRGL